MKLRESGMPDENMWDEFFNPTEILNKLNISSAKIAVADLGCGYGTFTIPAAKLTNLPVFSFDIEEKMISLVQKKAVELKLQNVNLTKKDFMNEGTGLEDNSVDYVMVFNLLHGEFPEKLLTEAYRILQAEGTLSVIHWNYDDSTPRGPSMDIRPKPEQIIKWARDKKFQLFEPKIELPPYHYGLLFKKDS